MVTDGVVVRMALTNMLPQGPNRHCGNLELHERHALVEEFVPVDREGFGQSRVVQAWCDGIPPLEAFYELTTRVPLESFQIAGASHEEALNYLRDNGGLLFIMANVINSKVVLRVRAGGEDRVYPIIAGRNGGFSMVVDAPPPFGDVQS
jgi:hypothetical protein